MGIQGLETTGKKAMRAYIKKSKRWVVKIGSSLVTNNGLGLDTEAISHWTEQIVGLQNAGHQVVLVSSGAVAEGVARLGLATRPVEVHLQQAAAAVGQMGLVQAYESCFQRHNVHTAQILLSHEDLSDRTRYLNARSTLTTLLEMGVVPVVNENDTVATEEICFGDNDTLAALVANLVNADLMVILTDQDGLFSEDPRKNPAATLVSHAAAGDENLAAMASEGSSLGRGGMMTKLSAAKLAARSGSGTLIANGSVDNILHRVAQGEALGTFLQAGSEPVTARKQWLAGQLKVKGSLQLDAGAVKVLAGSGKSLLAVGITSVTGRFHRGEVVALTDAQDREIGRGLVNYNHQELAKIKGHSSAQFSALLGYSGEEEVVHRDNLILQ